mgnify:CR=1 FL=1
MVSTIFRDLRHGLDGLLGGIEYAGFHGVCDLLLGNGLHSLSPLKGLFRPGCVLPDDGAQALGLLRLGELLSDGDGQVKTAPVDPGGQVLEIGDQRYRASH